MFHLTDLEELKTSTTTWPAGTVLGVAREGFTYVVVPASAGDHHVETAGGVRLYVLPRRGGTLHVDAFGAAGDGLTDDSETIERALRAVPENGHIRFGAGRTYLVSREINARGKAMTVTMTGATIRVADDSVWNVFRFGGLGYERSDWVGKVEVIGGTFDGNRANQRYWPNTDGTTIFTDRGIEDYGTHTGTPWYPNSPVNGLAWDNRWIGGTAEDGIDVNGSGNEGLVTITATRHAVYRDCFVKNYVRNGLVAYICDDVDFIDCRSEGQLPTNYQELNLLFGKGYEAAALKTNGWNPQDQGLRGDYPGRVRISGGRSLGGAMPLFVRTNTPKPESPTTFVTVEGFEALGFSRDAWFEVASFVRISDCNFVGIYDPAASSHRGRSGLFIGNGTTDYSIVNTNVIHGVIDTREQQQNRTGLVEGCTISCENAGQVNPIVQCRHLKNSHVESAGRGPLVDFATNVEAHAELNSSLQVRRSAQGCRTGRIRRCAAASVFAMAPGSRTVDLGATSAVIERVFRHNPHIHGGAKFEIWKAEYHLSDGVVTFDRSAVEGDVVTVEWYAPATESFTVATDETDFTLSAPGGERVDDIPAVTHDPGGTGSPVALPPRKEVADPGMAPHWTMSASASGRTTVQLVSLALAAGDVVTITSLPPMVPYAGPRITSNETWGSFEFDVVNTRSCRIDGRARVSGSLLDMADSGFVLTDKNGEVAFRNLTARRLRHGFVGGSVRDISIRDCHVIDWGLAGSAAPAPDNLRCIGDSASSGLSVSGVHDMRNNLFLRSLEEGAASPDMGRTENIPPRLLVRTNNLFVNTSNDGSFFGAVKYRNDADGGNEVDA
jgi:hypothetical protein